jgi:hypothetical protein
MGDLVVQQLKDEFGTSSASPNSLEFETTSDLKKAFAILDGTEKTREDLMSAQFGYPDYDSDPKNKGGAFTKTAEKKGMSVMDLIDEMVEKSQDLSDAKAMVLESWVKHIIMQHGATGADAGGHAT